MAILARLRFAVAPAHSVDEAVRVMQALRPTLIVARLRDEPALRGPLLVPEGALKIQYDPNDDPDKRKPAVEQWKKLIPEGKLPPKIAAGPPGKPREGR